MKGGVFIKLLKTKITQLFGVLNKVYKRKLVRIYIPILLLLFIIMFLLFSSNYTPKTEIFSKSVNTLLDAFTDSGAQPVSSEAYFWSKAHVNSYDSLKKIASEIADRLKLLRDESYFENECDNDNAKKYEIDGFSESGARVLIGAFHSYEVADDNYISLSVMKYDSLIGFKNAAELLYSLFKEFGLEPEFNFCIVGNFDGQLDYISLNGICTDILEKANAHSVEGIREGNMISVSAYSPIIKESISTNGRKVNINLAIRYNSYEDKTYIWLATPVITRAY